MTVITFEQIAERLAEHARAEAARNAPEAVARRAVYTLSSALADLGPVQRAEVLVLVAEELRPLIAELPQIVA